MRDISLVRTAVFYAALFGSVPLSGFAVTLNVDTMIDDPAATTCDDGKPNDCSLRGAITRANTTPGIDTIRVPAGVYTLTVPSTDNEDNNANGDLDVNASVSIEGAGSNTTFVEACTIVPPATSCSATNRVFDIDPLRKGVTVSLKGLTIRNGLMYRYADIYGGGLRNRADLTLTDVTITNNAAGGPSTTGYGGGISNESPGKLTLRNSRVTKNLATYGGGGLSNGDFANLTIENSVVSDNSTSQGGGGIFSGFSDVGIGTTNVTVLNSTISGNVSGASGGGIAINRGTLVMKNTTITNNAATASGGGVSIGNFYNGPVALNNITITGNQAGISGGTANAGAGIAIFNGRPGPIVSNSIIAGNKATYGVGPDCYGAVNSAGFNLIQEAYGCNLTGDTATNILGKNPLLGVLTDNGGPTLTMGLGADSPALNSGSPNEPGSGNGACSPIDQRGVSRPQGARCDIGAFESQGGFTATGVAPNHAGNRGGKWLLINGSGLQATNVPSFTCGSTVITGSGVSIDAAGTTLTANFDLTGIAPMRCDLTVKNSAGVSITVPGALTVEPATAPALWSSIGTRRAIRVGAPNTFRIYFGNTSNTDAYGVALGLYLTTNITASLHIAVTPPLAQPGDVSVDWSYVPIKELSVTPGFNTVPLLLPVVPAGFTGELEITVSASPDLHGQQFTIATGIGPAITSSASDVDPVLLADFVSGAKQYATKYLNTTIASSQEAALTDYYTKEIQQIVVAARNASIMSLIQNAQTYSLTQIQIAGVSHILQLPPHYVGGGGSGGGGSGGGGGGGGSPGDGNGGAGSGGGDDSGDDDCSWIGWCDPPPPSQPPCEKWPPTACGGASPAGGPLTGSLDPNDIAGPAGAGGSRFITGTLPLFYTIHFENLATATAAAQKVVVTEPLDGTKVNFSSVALGPVTIGKLTFTPPPGVQQFAQLVDLRPGQNLVARVAGKFDQTTGMLSWTFSSLDPTTLELTQDPLAGFLPPNVAPPAGEGSVSYSVTMVSNISSGTSVCAQAAVVFDANAAISTPAWCNAIDKTAPVSAVAALPATQSVVSFPVAWSGSDPDSGISSFNIFVSDNSAPFVLWMKGTTDVTSTYNGQWGHSYSFVAQAVDAVGNTEVLRIAADTSTTLTSPDTTPAGNGTAPPPPGSNENPPTKSRSGAFDIWLLSCLGFLAAVRAFSRRRA